VKDQEHEHMMGDILEPMAPEIDGMGSTFYDFRLDTLVLVDERGRALLVSPNGKPFSPDDLPDEYVILKVVAKEEYETNKKGK
tara:strand:- start:233 stop:481 length:249 start_codon:yes stop_codon:yes gene_type:complete